MKIFGYLYKALISFMLVGAVVIGCKDDDEERIVTPPDIEKNDTTKVDTTTITPPVTPPVTPVEVRHTIELSATKSSIKANGKDTVYFVVEVDSQAVSSGFAIKIKDEANTALEGAAFETRTPGTYTFIATYDTLTSEEVQVTAGEVVFVFTTQAATTSIKANNSDKIVFIATLDGEDVTAAAKITCLNDGTELAGNEFATKTAGEYVFSCEYEDYTAATVTVTVTPIYLTMQSDVYSIKANGKSEAVFTASLDGEDVTALTEFFYKKGNIETKLSDNKFITEEDGDYECFCRYDEYADTLTVKAIPVVVTLTSDATSIKASGRVSATFTIMADDEDVTDAAQIFCIKDGALISVDKEFNTTVAGVYEFYAKYRNFNQSNTLTIEAVESQLVISSSASEAELKAGQSVNLTGILDGTEDISDEMKIYAVHNGQEELLTGLTFTPQEYGTYSIYATYNDKPSNSLYFSVKPFEVVISENKSAIKFTGRDSVNFSVMADGIATQDVEIYLMSGDGDMKLPGNAFTSEEEGKFAFYAVCAGVRSVNSVEVSVIPASFAKQSVLFQFVASWCGYSPELLAATNEIFQYYSNKINVVTMHPNNSTLGSKDINTSEYDAFIPFGTIDFLREPAVHRDAAGIRSVQKSIELMYPPVAGIAISSQHDGHTIDVTLKVKSKETNEYSVGAFIVEDNIVMPQRLYPTFINTDGAYYIDDYVHFSIATYCLPDVYFKEGQSIGTVEYGTEKTFSFSVSMDKDISNPPYNTRKILNPDNCRVVAYVMKKNSYYGWIVNNSATAPINGSVGYNYAD